MSQEMTPLEEAAMTTLLNHRFGDGSIYVQGREDRLLLKKARRLGFVSNEGYLTPEGYRFVHTHEPPAEPGSSRKNPRVVRFDS